MSARIYLASRSPRRRELLTQIGVAFDTLLFRSGNREDAQVDETPLPQEEVRDYVCRVARAKALHGVRLLNARHLLVRPVLSADTTLEVDGHIIGKPANAADAAAILQRLSGREHRVLTAVAVACEGNRLEQALSISTVRFGNLSEEEIQRYVATGEPLDKAGAYGIQGRAGVFVERLEGSYTGVMGLPVHETAQLLRRVGYPI
jgi:septum formation protein